MSICLCNLSADVALELLAKNKEEPEAAEPLLESFSCDPDEAKTLLGDFMESLPQPVELLVDSASKRREAEEFACHVHRGAVPPGAFLKVREEIYVTSPEYTLLQQANQLHQASLCQMLGRYLGVWMPDKESGTGQDERAPLTTLEQLDGFLRNAGSARGLRNLRLAMNYTCEGAASRPETSLQLALSLPPELRGLWLPQPIMNYEVDLSEHAQRLCGRKTIRIDLCWPHASFGLEYQGKDHERTMGADYARWFAAREAGYELWLVAHEQLSSAFQMDHIGREVAKRLGVAIDESLWPSNDELQGLLDTLAGHKHPKLLGRDELRKLKRKYRGYQRRTQLLAQTHDDKI